MNWLRRGFVLFLSLIMFSCLLGAVSAVGFKNTFSNPDKIKTWVADSGLYDQLVSATLDRSQDSAQADGTTGTVALTDPEVQEAAQQAFTPELLRDSFNTFIDSNYAWLNGQTAAPDFNIDLTQAKQQFAEQVGQYAESRLAVLPVCTPEQLAQIPIPADPLTVVCRPALLDPAIEGARVTQEINDNNEILKDSAVTASTLSQGEGEEGAAPSEPYNQQFSEAPQAYKLATHMPWILGLAALFCAAGIVLLAATRRRGWRRIAIVSALAGLVLIITRLMSDLLTSKLEDRAQTYAGSDKLEQPLNYLVRQLEPSLLGHYLWFGVALLAVAAIIFGLLFKTRQGSGKPRKPKAPEASFDEISEPPTRPPRPKPAAPIKNAGNLRLSPKRGRPTGSAGSAPRPSVSPNAKPLGKTPTRRKPPRLVQ